MEGDIIELIETLKIDHKLPEAELEKVIKFLASWADEGLNYLSSLVDKDAVELCIDVNALEYIQTKSLYRRHVMIPLLIPKIREVFKDLEEKAKQKNESQN